MKTFKWKPVLPGANQGFTLIEVLIAMAIFSIGILAVGTLILSTTRNNTNGNILTQATMLARAKIEEKKREADAGALTHGTETETNIDMQGNPGGIYTRECVCFYSWRLPANPGDRQLDSPRPKPKRGVDNAELRIVNDEPKEP